jgi:hypothetical protein
MRHGVIMKTALILFSVLYITALAFTATIYVPDDYPLIQQAVGAAADGDTIIVKPGTYVEKVDFLGKAITVQSEQGPESTIIRLSGSDRNANKSVVTFKNNEDQSSILQGFTLQNGKGTNFENAQGYDVHCGGGILCADSSPTILNCIVRSNEAGNRGAGMYLNNGEPKIVGC